jgi:hypothetical protein
MQMNNMTTTMMISIMVLMSNAKAMRSPSGLRFGSLRHVLLYELWQTGLHRIQYLIDHDSGHQNGY